MTVIYSWLQPAFSIGVTEKLAVISICNWTGPLYSIITSCRNLQISICKKHQKEDFQGFPTIYGPFSDSFWALRGKAHKLAVMQGHFLADLGPLVMHRDFTPKRSKMHFFAPLAQWTYKHMKITLNTKTTRETQQKCTRISQLSRINMRLSNSPTLNFC